MEAKAENSCEKRNKSITKSKIKSKTSEAKSASSSDTHKNHFSKTRIKVMQVRINQLILVKHASNHFVKANEVTQRQYLYVTM